MQITWMTCGSFTPSNEQKDGRTPCCTTWDTCSFLPLIVKLLMAQAASFCVWNSPCKISCQSVWMASNERHLFHYTVHRWYTFCAPSLWQKIHLLSIDSFYKHAVNVTNLKFINTFPKWWITIGISPASITACTCCWLPAVMFDKNHTASYKRR